MKTGRRAALGSVTCSSTTAIPIDPALWSEDRYFREQIELHRHARRDGDRDRRLRHGAGLRDRRRTHGLPRRRAHARKRRRKAGAGCARASRSTAAQQRPIPSAPRSATTRTPAANCEGGYTKSFPSVHLTHDITRESQGAAELVHELRPAAAEQPPAERNRQRDRADAHDQQSQPAAADRRRTGTRRSSTISSRSAIFPSAGFTRRSRTTS